MIRPINLEQDYPMICEWWIKHEAPVIPSVVFLPAFGLVADCAAAAWLFVCEGTQGGVGLIEFTTTNPEAPAKARLSAVKEVYAGLESLAKEKGCGSVLALVGVNSSERRIMEKSGYLNTGGEPHLIYGKPL